MKVLAIIIARGGSQRVPNKNIRLLAGKPLLAYSIECGKRSRYVERVVVSTDSDAIADFALKAGAEVPFRRPAQIAQSHSTELQAMEHALGWFRDQEKYQPDFVVLLRPTSPFRTTATIDRGIELLRDNPAAHCVRTVRLCSEHPHKMWVMEGDGRRIRSLIPVEQKLPEAHTLSYQLLPTVYIQNASMDVFRPSNVWQLHSTTGTEIIPLVNDEYESVDINTEIDFLLAETLLARKKFANASQSEDDSPGER